MANIQVFFENRGDPKNLNVVVLNPRQPVLQDEGVHWHFQAENPDDVDMVRIQFEDEGARYFGTANPTTCERLLAEGDTIFGRPPEKRKPADPEPKPDDTTKQIRMHGYRDKYTITAYKNGARVGIRDPEIVPIRPSCP